VHARLQDPLPHTELSVERPHTVFHGRRGHGHGALGCGRPAPAPTFSCNRTTYGSKAGFTAVQDTAQRTRLTPGLAARHALGAAHDGAAHIDAARHGVIPQPTCNRAKSTTETATALGHHGLG
jgi:hypothetical protein